MDADSLEKIAVLGAGNMGHGITESVAIGGYSVTMRDVETDLVQDGHEAIAESLERLAESGHLEESPDRVLDRIETTVDIEAAVADADLVIEAAPEQMSLKQDIFGEVDELAPSSAILASNTSSLSISDIASATGRPGQVVGAHFFNPPVRMDLVEVIRGAETSDRTVETTLDFVDSLGKTPIEVKKDVRGFVVNTILFPLILEPAWMLSAGETTIREADAAMVHQRGYPMGPFELTDLTGIDVNYHVLQEADRDVPPIMTEKVDDGHVGRKVGQGYYDHEDGGADYEEGQGADFDTFRIEARMVDEAARLVGEDVATPEAIDTGVKLGASFPEGICERGDELGLDAVRAKLLDLRESSGEQRFTPSEALNDMVDAGRTGVEAGEGFYEYD
jgi:enoyl-CoA hydratase/3-hydroxyacyl-CoA dehydrogenase